MSTNPTLFSRLFSFKNWAVIAGLSISVLAHADSIVVASTTSTEQSGLFAHLLPEFKRVTGIDVKVVALGTGQALDLARRGDADVAFVHDEAAEKRFVEEGFADKRYNVMYNDFVLVGPSKDPAGAKGNDMIKALGNVAKAQAAFISRGDKSGTHAAEQRYFALAKIDPASLTEFKSCGCGMGPALNMAASTQAYLVSDRGTWLNFKNNAGLSILVEGDKRLFNPYSVMIVSNKKHPQVKTALAQKWVDWLISKEGQAHIADYKINGQQLFFPSAN